MRIFIGEVTQTISHREVVNPTVHQGILTTAYFNYADNLLDRGIYAGSRENPIPDSFRPPGYPFFLAGVRLLSGRNQWENWVAAAQYLMGALVCVLIAVLGAQIIGFRVGIIAGFISVFYLELIYMTIPFLRETLAAFLLLMTLNCFTFYLSSKKPIWLPAAAGFFGAAMLTRPEIFLVGIILIFLFRRDLRLVGATDWEVLLPSVVLAFGPWGAWMIRNFLVHHHFIPFSTEGAWALFMGQVYPPHLAVPYGDIRATEIIQASSSEYGWYSQMNHEAIQAILSHPFTSIAWIWPKINITFQEHSLYRTGLFFPFLSILIPALASRTKKERIYGCALGAVIAVAILFLSKWDRTIPVNLLRVSYSEVVVLAAIGFPLMLHQKKYPKSMILAVPFCVVLICNALLTSHLRQRVVLADWVLILWAAYFISWIIDFLQPRLNKLNLI